MDYEKIAEAFAKRGLVPSLHFHEGPQIYDNNIDKLILGYDTQIVKHHSRLSLFVANETQQNIFIADLDVCENTADVCRAVEKLSGGRVPSKYKEMDFAAALLPYLKFPTTKSAIYQALNKIP